MIECPDVEGCRDKLYRSINKKVSIAVFTTLILVTIGLIGSVFGFWNDSISRAQDKAEASVEKHETRLNKLEVAVEGIKTNIQNIEKKVDKAIEDSDKKQEAILDAIEKIKPVGPPAAAGSRRVDDE